VLSLFQLPAEFPSYLFPTDFPGRAFIQGRRYLSQRPRQIRSRPWRDQCSQAISVEVKMDRALQQYSGSSPHLGQAHKLPPFYSYLEGRQGAKAGRFEGGSDLRRRFLCLSGFLHSDKARSHPEGCERQHPYFTQPSVVHNDIRSHQPVVRGKRYIESQYVWIGIDGRAARLTLYDRDAEFQAAILHLIREALAGPENKRRRVSGVPPDGGNRCQASQGIASRKMLVAPAAIKRQ
jgi:hypothetical protein